MKIKALEFKNKYQEWEFEKISFFDLTLLVGVSGVGKTQILRSVNELKKVAGGNSINGIEWNFSFDSLEGHQYIWKGSFETIATESEISSLLDFDEENSIKPKIIFEQVYLNGELIIDRKENEIYLERVLTPKLSSNQSVLYIFKEEDKIKPAIESFKMIILRDHTEKTGIHFSRYYEKLKNKYNTIEEIKESDIDTISKLALVHDKIPDVFQEIKAKFIEVFAQVEDVIVEPYKNDSLPFTLETSIIQIKEKDVNSWIPQNRMSSGMMRTLLHISEMYLWKKGTVILIDEFENSLGVNCIDILTEDLIFENNDIQFIATSHHPYIINKIPFEYWKIVTRHGGHIKTFDAKEFNLGETKHERFISLINLPVYINGAQ